MWQAAGNEKGAPDHYRRSLGDRVPEKLSAGLPVWRNQLLGVLVTLRIKFVLPVNLILIAVLTASLAWEWWRLEQNSSPCSAPAWMKRHASSSAAARTFGITRSFAEFLEEFCHATDAAASPEHQVALIGPDGEVVASAAADVNRPINPSGLTSLAVGSWLRRRGDESSTHSGLERG